jgi:adenylate cyclase
MERAHLRRKLTAVLIADVVAYSRLMSVDEEDTHVRLSEFVKAAIEPTVAKHHGRLIRTAGDGFLCEFDSAVGAVHCALELQERLAGPETAVAPNRRLQFRMAINTGDVIVGGGDIHGNSVNVAARLEGLAQPGEIYVTQSVRDQLRGYPSLAFVDKGRHRVKNIVYPIRIYRVERVADQRRVPTLIALGRRFCRPQLFRRHRSAVAISVLLLLTGAVTLGALPSRIDYSQVSPRASIMVTPFRNASGNPEEDYFADAVTDNLTTDLSRLSDTAVISPATAFTYKGKAVNPREINRELGVRYLLQGSIRKAGMKVQTNAQLVDTRTAAQIWADRFDNELAGLSDLQDAVTGRIASSLHIQLIKAENRRAIAERPTDPDAIDLRLRAMALIVASPTPERALAARQLLQESVRLDPQSAESWSQLAWAFVNDYLNHWNEAKQSPEAGKELLRRAEQALQEALKIDPSIAMAHYAEGLIRRARGDHPGALDAFDRAVQLDPNFARALTQKGNQLVMLGRPKEAPPLILKAITLSPRDPYVGGFYWAIGRAYFVMKDYDNAIVWLRKSAEMLPNLWYNRAYLLAAYALTGRHEQPEGLTAMNEYQAGFSGYTVQRIRSMYEKELPHPDPGMQASIQELYKGLQLAGVAAQ